MSIVVDETLPSLLAPIFAEFLRQFPDFCLHVTTVDKAPDLSAHDANVTIFANGQPPGELVGRRIARIAWALYGSDRKSTPNRRDRPMGDDNASERLPDEQPARRRVILSRAGKGTSDGVVYKASTLLGLAAAVEGGVGLGALPCYLGDLRPGLVRLSAPEFNSATDLWLLTCPDLGRSARVRQFVDFVAVELSRLRPLFEGEGMRV
ncbi:LysR substrate-binding domain-containing protein [uncultured Paracoccus sp.]|uniref:LysR substrate-binding domain-containing protein n=1 Tax=uncultured Paracoccus sp. TaxID=189685 RepID=UPI00260830EE|nr:LysR substrate-binding domain-containing protein [uncultured Paracoccus sp.]